MQLKQDKTYHKRNITMSRKHGTLPTLV